MANGLGDLALIGSAFSDDPRSTEKAMAYRDVFSQGRKEKALREFGRALSQIPPDQLDENVIIQLAGQYDDIDPQDYMKVAANLMQFRQMKQQIGAGQPYKPRTLFGEGGTSVEARTPEEEKLYSTQNFSPIKPGPTPKPEKQIEPAEGWIRTPDGGVYTKGVTAVGASAMTDKLGKGYEFVQGTPPASGKGQTINVSPQIFTGAEQTVKPTRPTETSLQKEIVGNLETLRQARQIKDGFRKEFHGIEGKSKDFVSDWADWLSMGKIESAKKWRQAFRPYKNNVKKFLSKYVNEISGAQFSIKEFETYKDQIINEDMGPTDAEVTIDNMISDFERALRLKQQMLSEGIPVGIATTTDAADLAARKFKNRFSSGEDVEGDEFGTALKKLNPNITMDDAYETIKEFYPGYKEDEIGTVLISMGFDA